MIKPVEHFLTAIKDIKELPPTKKSGIIFLSITYFLALLSYPILRSTTTSIFFKNYGAKNSPQVWLYSIVALTIFVAISNLLQKKITIQILYFITALFSFMFFIVGEKLLSSGIEIWAYFLYIWKESYIILLLHQAIGLFNATTNLSFAKSYYGILGVFGSVGGILGGLLTSSLTNYIGIGSIIYVGAGIIMLSAVTFFATVNLNSEQESSEKNDEFKNVSPISSIRGASKYVFSIVLLVMITQFVINLGNYKFNLVFADIVQDNLLRTKYLGYIFTSINTVALLIQLILLPPLLKGISLRTIHITIPLIYSVSTILGFGIGATMLLPVAVTFIIYKGFDYSLFAAAKELLYFPLTPKQRYGAKYLADMISYRLGKALISIALIFFTTTQFVNITLAISLIAWFIVAWALFVFLKRKL